MAIVAPPSIRRRGGRRAPPRAAAAVHHGQEIAQSATLPPRQALSRTRGVGWVVLIFMVAFAVLFALVRTKRSAATDLAVTMRLQRRRQPWLRRTMDIVSWPGFPPQSRLIPPALAGIFWSVGFRVEAVFQLAAWGTTFLSFFFKRLMRRPRPEHPEIRVAIANIGGSSFPSGHVLGYVGVYGFLAYLANTWLKPKRLRRAIVGALLGLISLVGPSRIYLGHHWFTDVLASYFLGTSYLLGVTELYRRVKLRQAARRGR